MTMRSPFRLAALMPIAAGAALLAGCGGAADLGRRDRSQVAVPGARAAARPRSTTASGIAVNVCSIMPAATAAAVSGLAITVAQEQDTPSYKLWVCNYTTADGTNGVHDQRPCARRGAGIRRQSAGRYERQAGQRARRQGIRRDKRRRSPVRQLLDRRVESRVGQRIRNTDPRRALKDLSVSGHRSYRRFRSWHLSIRRPAGAGDLEERGGSRMSSDGGSVAGANAPAPALSVDRLTKRFDNRTAFEDLSLEVAPGEVFGFLGPNGAGQDHHGAHARHLDRAHVGRGDHRGDSAHALRTASEIRQHISIMPEAPGLYSRLSVTENLRVLRRLVRAATIAGHAHPRMRCGAVNLADRAATCAAACRKGCASVWGSRGRCSASPEIMFLDEPTSGLDPVAAREVHDLINGLRQKGVTIFLTTHRLDEAQRLCDRVAILNTTLRTVGRPGDLREETVHQGPRRHDRGAAQRSGRHLRRCASRRELALRAKPRPTCSRCPIRHVAAPEVARRLVGRGRRHPLHRRDAAFAGGRVSEVGRRGRRGPKVVMAA